MWDKINKYGGYALNMNVNNDTQILKKNWGDTCG
jgi:hypothetical protein